MDMSPDPYESRLYKLSVKSKNSPIGVRMKSWQPLQLGSILQSESNIQNVLDLDSSFPCTKSDVVAWWTSLAFLFSSPLDYFAGAPLSTALSRLRHSSSPNFTTPS
jgi:hypothetical protein